MAQRDRISNKRDQLSGPQRLVVEERLNPAVKDQGPNFSMMRRNSADSAPLSFGQERMWFLNQLEPKGYRYNIAAVVRLSGSVNIEALQQSSREIVRRHELLRTKFVAYDGKPIQRLTTSTRVCVLVVDLREAVFEQNDNRPFDRLACGEALRPFDLEKGPILRITLVMLKAETKALLFTVHHIACDGWSMQILIREFKALYRSYASCNPSCLEELPIQYSDYAMWQREWLSGSVLDQQLDYWKSQLQGAATLELPTDRARPARQSYRGASFEFELSSSLTERLTKLSAQHGVTLFMTLLAAFKVLLYRYTGQTDLCVGTPIANRTRREVEDLIGFFVNTLVLRTDLGGNPPFSTLLQRVRHVALEAYAHQDLPFERLVEELQPERDLSRSPLFQVMFVFQKSPEEDLDLPGSNLESISIDRGTSKFDLTLSVWETAHGMLRGSIEYSTDVFVSSRIERMSNHYINILEQFCNDVDSQIDGVCLLSEEERIQLRGWNATDSDLSNCCIHEIFESQATRNPDRIAIVCGAQQISYSKLNARANQLASYLRRFKVGPEILVGIYMDRSVDLIVSILGILKAGGTYVPLDPENPPARTQAILKDTGLSILLTQQTYAEKTFDSEIVVLPIDRKRDQIATEHAFDLGVPRFMENLAYLMYTSGSTGGPKGVGLSHRSLANLVHWHRESMIGGSVLQFASPCFDASFHEMFGAWCAGCTLHLMPNALKKDLRAITGLVAEHRIEKIIVPVIVLRYIAKRYHDSFDDLASLRAVICTGEQLSIDNDVRLLFAENITGNLHNHYGPTETHVVTSHELKKSYNQKVWKYTEGDPTLPL